MSLKPRDLLINKRLINSLRIQAPTMKSLIFILILLSCLSFAFGGGTVSIGGSTVVADNRISEFSKELYLKFSI